MTLKKFEKYLFSKQNDLTREMMGEKITNDFLLSLEEEFKEKLEKDGLNREYIDKLKFQCRHGRKSLHEGRVKFSFNHIEYVRLFATDEEFVSMLSGILS